MMLNFNNTVMENQRTLEIYAMKKVEEHFNKLENAREVNQLHLIREEFEKWHNPFDRYVEEMVRVGEIKHYFMKDREFLQLTDSLLLPRLSLPSLHKLNFDSRTLN